MTYVLCCIHTGWYSHKLINTLECDLFTITMMQIKTRQFIINLKKQALRNHFLDKIQNSERDYRDENMSKFVTYFVTRYAKKKEKMKMNYKKIYVDIWKKLIITTTTNQHQHIITSDQRN